MRLSTRGRALAVVSVVWVFILALPFAGCHFFVFAQDGASGAIRGTVMGPTGDPIPSVLVEVTNTATGMSRSVPTDGHGSFAVQLLPPGEYIVTAQVPGIQGEARVQLDVGASLQLTLRTTIAGRPESVTVSADPGIVETTSSAVSSVIDESEIAELPLNGRRFSDLALLTPGVTEDPRGLTSSTRGDLAFGGVRGVYSSFMVDGADNNNGFFAQARGRYRAPYQFSNDVIQEFRVSSNAYGAELGRAGGAVINVVTKSGSNRLRGSAFYYVRDSAFNAQPAFVGFKPSDRQHQLGFTVGGPIKKGRVFFFGGFDQHIFRVPAVVHFLNGYPALAPQPSDFELSDYNLVLATAQALSKMGGEFRSRLDGNAGFLKLDFSLTPAHFLSTRISTSRYYGENNVFFDSSSPITTSAISENGEERVSTESAILSLTSALSYGVSSQFRTQISRDLEDSSANADFPRTRIFDVIDGFGRSSILPRTTHERKVHISETVMVESRRHSWKFGGDVLQAWIYNYFPLLFGGQYTYSEVDVNPFTFVPELHGLTLTPLRAYAHGVPRYYSQNFGVSESRPDGADYSAFAQDTVRVNHRLAISLGVRYDYQSFRSDRLVSNPLWPGSGRVPTDTNNLAPRFGFAYRLGGGRPFVLRGGYGWFYPRIPSIYPSQVEVENGLNRSHLLLDNEDFYQRAVFPMYPNPLVACGVAARECAAPASVAGMVTSDVSAFAADFRTPMVVQSSLGVEREVAHRFAVGANYLYVHGEHLIRARDVNLPPPLNVQYPVYDEAGDNFTGQFYTVGSFVPWLGSCGSPPCLGEVTRPLPQLGAINVFESAASSIYHGLTVSARRRMTNGLYFRSAYTWAKAIDDGQDALVVGRPATVQDSYDPQSERGLSATDQRQRFVFSWIAEPRPFHREDPLLAKLLNNWTISGVVTAGSGRPVNARVVGDPNGDANTGNDRLPGYRRNSFTGPTYTTTSLRLKRRFYLRERLRLDFLAESFNLLNHLNQRVDTSDDGFLSSAATFVPQQRTAGGRRYPAHYRMNGKFLTPASAYAPRQLQFSIRLTF